MVEAKTLTYKERQNLPNSAYAYVDKDGRGHFPYRHADGSIDEAHLNNALARLNHSNFSPDIKAQIHAKLLRVVKSLGKTHKPCSIPGCKGYAPKSMLEVDAFAAHVKQFKRMSEELSKNGA